jgi:hypothetical protein
VFAQAQQAEAFLFATFLQARPESMFAGDSFFQRFSPMNAADVAVALTPGQ